MPVQLRVGHPALTINQGSTFVMTDDAGEIRGSGPHGIFAQDTRFVSHYALYANGDPWRPVTSSPIAYNAARIYLTNADLETEDGPIPADTISLVISREVGEGIHEDLEITNFARMPVRFNFEIAIRSDFADIFEVRRRRFVRRGRVSTEWRERAREMRTTYENRDFTRALSYRVNESDSEPHLANGRVTFEVRLEPSGVWRCCAGFALDLGAHERPPTFDHGRRARETEQERLQQTWEASVSALRCSNEDLRHLYLQSVEDIGALRLHEHDMSPHVWVPAAGVPWYVTVFGRDSLIVGLQTMPVHSGLARGALQKLGALQAKERDDARDAQPGKIPHEIRSGELAHFGTIPHTPYYGTADATALYLITLDELWRWTGDRDVLERHRDSALACLEWIDRYGDLDGDGLQEYRTFSKQGYENMGWKDSATSVVDAEGRAVAQPKALVELQGYVFDAWQRTAEVFEALGDRQRAADLRRKAAVLRDKVEARFWCEEEGTYAFALDPDKRRADAVASNAGHLLWSGLPSPERARRVASRLFQDDMWSGWGIRTLSARNPAYNPHSYHRGSVWPHDNGIIAIGLRRYGLVTETARVAKAVLDAASCFVSYRLPELYAGIERTADSFPVQYLDANVPQAWAAGSVFHLVRALLGLRADAPHGALTVDPVLPEWLPELSLERVHVGTATVDLRVWRDGERTRWDVPRREGDVEVRQEAWAPWPVEEPEAEETAPDSAA